MAWELRTSRLGFARIPRRATGRSRDPRMRERDRTPSRLRSRRGMECTVGRLRHPSSARGDCSLQSRRTIEMPRTRQGKVAMMEVAEDVARFVPGYKGYHEPSLRREDDRKFRSSVAELLNGEAHRLERIESKQFKDDFSDLLEELDGDARKLEFLAESIVLVEHAQRPYQ